MKKLYFLIFVLIFCQITVSSQPCIPDGITFSTQAQIDNFQTNHPNCTEIEGDVEIDGDDINNLSGLIVVTSIGGYLYIRNNSSLTSLSGLDNVTSIGGYLQIAFNNALTSLSGLDNVTSIGEDLQIAYNESLTSLTGLDNVTSIYGKIYLLGNYLLTSLSGLEGVTTIWGGLYIGSNNALTSLSGLDNVTSIVFYLSISSNDALTSLTGLDNVTSIGGDLYIASNNALTSLSGLDNIEAESIEDLTIMDNPYLSHCSVLSICNYLSNSNDTIVIDENTTGCDSPEEVQDSCYWVSVDDLNTANNFFIFPNPAQQEVNISLEGFILDEINIYNLTGQLMLNESTSNDVIDVSGLRSGMYIIEVVVDNTKARQKLMVWR